MSPSTSKSSAKLSFEKKYTSCLKFVSLQNPSYHRSSRSTFTSSSNSNKILPSKSRTPKKTFENQDENTPVPSYSKRKLSITSASQVLVPLSILKKKRGPPLETYFCTSLPHLSADLSQYLPKPFHPRSYIPPKFFTFFKKPTTIPLEKEIPFIPSITLPTMTSSPSFSSCTPVFTSRRSTSFTSSLSLSPTSPLPASSTPISKPSTTMALNTSMNAINTTSVTSISRPFLNSNALLWTPDVHVIYPQVPKQSQWKSSSLILKSRFWTNPILLRSQAVEQT
ncbi:hypothetical protein HMI54_004337 [Coelomomyces lativittatus]|nr:hypothetical protein HMI54_004337 [Coelomomyces lativittatus]KAJ1512598.1 hypothetical protein HMI56_003839 [Coelomomyces lativittatus]KAJ1515825.1 hypothetical protein HMI55_003317 [Coelomomyces lativittatus]